MSNHQLTRWVLRHSWSRGLRRAGLSAAAVLAAGVVLIAPSAVSRGVPSASADDCPDAEVTFARGTDEPPGVGRVGQALVDSLRQQTGMNIGVYAVNYKASLLQSTPTTAPRTPYRTSNPWPTNARIRRRCWADTRRVRR